MNSESQTSSNHNVVKRGDWVVVRFGTDKTQLLNINDLRTLDLAGHTYGSQFEPKVTGSEPKEEPNPKKSGINQSGKKRKRGGNAETIFATLVLIDEPDISPENTYLERKRLELMNELEELEKLIETGKAPSDNRALQDNNKNQSIAEEDIESMKGTGMSGEKIVEALKENSKTFHTKSDHAQDKYLKNKKKKHSMTIRILKCNAQTIGEVLWQKTTVPGYLVAGIRYQDILPKLLAYGNVHYGARVLVCDTINGYLLGSVMERLGGCGEAITLYVGPTLPVNNLLNYFNFSEKEKSTLRRCDMPRLLADLPGDQHLQVIEAAEKRRREKLAAMEDSDKQIEEEVRFQEWFERKKKDRKELKIQKETFRVLREEGADSLVMIAKWEPQTSLLKLLPYLGSGRRFVVYSEYLEPLVRTRELLEEQKLAIGIRVVNTWFRQYQVIPLRTHPLMRMNGAGGYLLYGTKVENNPRVEVPVNK